MTTSIQEKDDLCENNPSKDNESSDRCSANIFIPIKDLLKTNSDNLRNVLESDNEPNLAFKSFPKNSKTDTTGKWNDNKDARTMFDNQISERAYADITKRVTNASIQQLHRQFHSKNRLKISFSKFFMCFIAAQYVILVLLFVVKAFLSPDFSDAIILTYMTSVFVETLGALVIMIVHAFDSKQEVQILNILNEVFSSFQK